MRLTSARCREAGEAQKLGVSYTESSNAVLLAFDFNNAEEVVDTFLPGWCLENPRWAVLSPYVPPPFGHYLVVQFRFFDKSVLDIGALHKIDGRLFPWPTFKQ